MGIWRIPAAFLCPANKALAWRMVVILLAPVIFFGVPVTKAPRTYVVSYESAAGLSFQIHHNRITDEVCLIFSHDPAPESLQKFICP